MWRNSLELSYYPTSDADNSALFRLQALNQRYYFNPDYDSTFLVGTALASRRLVNSVFGYGGYQYLYKQSDTLSAITRHDGDLFLGAVAYHPIGASRLVLHGYQFDFLRAAVPDTSYQGYSLYATLRDVTTERWVNSLSYRSQWRNFDVTGGLEWRNLLIGESSYRLLDWWSVEGEVIYLAAAASRKELSFTGWNFALFSVFSF